MYHMVELSPGDTRRYMGEVAKIVGSSVRVAPLTELVPPN